MRTDRQLAIKLRLGGKSYSEIRRELGGVSKGTLSLWLKDMVLPDVAKKRIAERTRERSLVGLLARNKNQTRLAVERRRVIMKSAASEIRHLSRRDLLLLGISLYWAEGYKRSIVKNGREVTYHPVGLTNSDPKLVKAFIDFLKVVCGVQLSGISANVRIFKHLNEGVVLEYWRKATGISPENFTKTYIGTSKSSMGKRPYNRLPYGVIQIRVNKTILFHKIMGWIEGLKNKF